MLIRRACLGVVATLIAAAGASATPLRLDYCVRDLGGGSYEYTFKLILDNNDQSWTPGQGFGWIVFGDSTTATPLLNFVGDPSSLPIGPFDNYSTTSGGHNGPNLSPVVMQVPPFPLNLWIPNAVGDSLNWKGTSSVNLPAGELLWSNLFNGSGAVAADFVAASVVSCTTGGCYANCDASTNTPVLNVNDFTCFLNRYAAGDSYANCDASTIIPALNVNDFTCFLNRYAAGCGR